MRYSADRCHKQGGKCHILTLCAVWECASGHKMKFQMHLLYSADMFIMNSNESFYISNLKVCQLEQVRRSTGSSCLVLSVEDCLRLKYTLSMVH
jgi:hypothetical protein